MIRKVSFEEAHSLLRERPDITLVDVREEPEYLTGHAMDAVLLPVDEITAETAAEVIGGGPVMVYCRTGRRSREAAHKLEQLGYQEIYDVGGLVGWPYGLV
ncbi:MAG: rhodanese-like domain-containing protein [Oscillospiraceae bacterium]|nr:rhodanese-like domain-containing protein [Oscillospiraceae bacterium]